MHRSLPIVTVALLLSPIALAADPAEGEAKPPLLEYRHEVYEGLGKHMKATSMIVKGKVDRPAADIAGHAKAMAAVGSFMTTMFPEGSGPEMGPTDALPAIWKDWKGFEEKAAAFTAEANKLAEMAESGADADALKGQFFAVGKSCGGCHKPFRKDDD